MSILASLDRSLASRLAGKVARSAAHDAAPRAEAATAGLAGDKLAHLAATLPSAKTAASTPPSVWEAITQAYASAAPAGRQKLAGMLQAAGFDVQALDRGRYVTLDAPDVRIVAEPAQDRFERVTGSDRVLYAHGLPTETMRTQGNGALLRANGIEQRWSTKAKDGEPVFPAVKTRPGELPRTASTPVNHLQLPDYNAILAELKAQGKSVAASGIDPQAYRAFADQLDQSVVRSGGRVIEPTSRVVNFSDPNAYNCHSFATTGGKGDLADPYDNPQRPRWLNSPLYQLKARGFAKLSPTQRVKPGDRVVYRLNGQITHTGIVRAVDAGGNPTRIESKWGNWGLFEHGAYDVPNIYGQPTDFYRSPS